MGHGVSELVNGLCQWDFLKIIILYNYVISPVPRNRVFPMAHLPQLILLTGSVNLCPNFCAKKHVPFTTPRISKVDPVIQSKHMGAIFPEWWFQPLWKKMSSSVGTIIPNYMGKIKVLFQTANQFQCFQWTMKTSIWPGFSSKFPWLPSSRRVTLLRQRGSLAAPSMPSRAQIRMLILGAKHRRWLAEKCHRDQEKNLEGIRWSVMKCWGNYGKRMETMEKKWSWSVEQNTLGEC